MVALVLCASLFGAGLYVVMTRREIIGLLTGVEMMLGAANVQLVMLGAAVGGTGATIEAAGLMVLVVAAAEAAVGLALLLALYRRSGRSRTDELNEVNG
ncbi:MAG: NADH-quinone oxidoreductase subunit NuoK [Coriobacteriales bacterium]|nr:NADH-quinone oxidoreductase subunit NuoK [Actinomycetes bacterium]